MSNFVRPQVRFLSEGGVSYLAVRVPPAVGKVGWRRSQRGIFIAFFASFLAAGVRDGLWHSECRVRTCYRTFIPVRGVCRHLGRPFFREDSSGRWLFFPF